MKKVSSPKTVKPSNSQAYFMDINIEIDSPSPITFLKSPSHPIKVLYANNGNRNAVINLDTFNEEVKYLPNKDFILVYRNEGINKP